MGYYSEIAVELLKPDYERLISELETISMPYNPMKIADVYEREEGGIEIVTVHWNSIKWYGEGVEPIQRFIEQVPYHVSEIGEEADDCTEHVSDDWPLDIDSVFIQRRIVGWKKGKRLSADK